MDKKISKVIPDYRRIYMDILDRDFPEKRNYCQPFLQKKSLSNLDVLKLNKEIFGMKNLTSEVLNQQHRAYDENTIREILDYQKKQNLNNSQLSRHFKISRNTVTKWKKIFCEHNN